MYMENTTGNTIMDVTGQNVNFTNNSQSLVTSSINPPEKYSMEYRIVATCLHVVIFLVGIFGNIAVVIVVRKTKSMHTPTYCYLVSLAVADLLVLISAMPEAIVSHYLYAGQYILGHAGCSLLTFMNFLGINASSTSILNFTIERYIGICHPLLAQKVCSVGRAKKFILGTWTFSVLYTSPWLGMALTKTVQHPGFEDMERCTFRLPRQFYVYFFLTDIVLFYVLPLLVSIVLYTQIGLVLHRSTHSSELRKNSTRRVNKSDKMASQPKNGECQPLQKQMQAKEVSQQDRSREQVVRMLLVVVILFAVLWLPYRGLLVFNSFAKKPWLHHWYLLFAKTLIYINSAINPVMYNVMSKRFRTAVLALCGCAKSESGSRTVTNSELIASRTTPLNNNRRLLSVQQATLGVNSTSQSLSINSSH